MTWEDNTFPDADKAEEVEWVIFYWRVTRCEGGCRGNYQLESRQFDHLVKATSREEALKRFQVYVDNKREAGKNSDVKNLVLFLARVDTMVRISDEAGDMV
jgi:hypothetical protein